MELYNKLSAKQRATLIEKAGGKRLTLSFYKYHIIKNICPIHILKISCRPYIKNPLPAT